MKIRLISGKYGGRSLTAPAGTKTHPAGERVRNAMFNSLGDLPINAEVLDAFAGSGSLGFEALSRQAKQVTFLELDKTVANQLKKNLQTLKTTNEQAQVINQNSLEFLKQAQNQPHFDVVFLDPPFHFGLAEQAIALLEEKNWLLPHALIYVETEKDKPLSVPENWQLLKEKTTGMVSYRLYQKN